MAVAAGLTCGCICAQAGRQSAIARETNCFIRLHAGFARRDRPRAQAKAAEHACKANRALCLRPGGPHSVSFSRANEVRLRDGRGVLPPVRFRAEQDRLCAQAKAAEHACETNGALCLRPGGPHSVSFSRANEVRLRDGRGVLPPVRFRAEQDRLCAQAKAAEHACKTNRALCLRFALPRFYAGSPASWLVAPGSGRPRNRDMNCSPVMVSSR